MTRPFCSRVRSRRESSFTSAPTARTRAPRPTIVAGLNPAATLPTTRTIANATAAIGHTRAQPRTAATGTGGAVASVPRRNGR